MNNVVKMPGAPESYVTVKQSGSWWTVQLVTPVGPAKLLRTPLERYLGKPNAVERAKAVAERMKRPYRGPEARQ